MDRDRVSNAMGPSYEHLHMHNARLRKQVARQQQRLRDVQRQLRQARSQIAQLQQDMAELQRQLWRNSSNSSLPPSANPPSAPPAVRKKPTGRKIGAQVGHAGHGRKLLPVEQVDQIIEHLPQRCGHCGSPLDGASREGEPAARHQVMELPQRAVRIIEHQACACRCRKCGKCTAARLPQELKVSVCGERLSAAICLLSSRVHGSRRAVAEMLGEMLGAPLALGSVSAREREISAALAPTQPQLRQHLQAAAVKHVDETRWRRARRWLWTLADQNCALFHLDRERGLHSLQRLLGQDDRGLELSLEGVVVTDRYGIYERIPLNQRGICWAHLKRDFTALAQGPPRQQSWGRRLLDVQQAVFIIWHQFQRNRRKLRQAMAPLQQRMHRLLLSGRRSGVVGVKGLCQNLLHLEAALWNFVRREGVAPTNNHAERMLRPAVQWRKKCLGSHSEEGCRFVERMLSVVQSCKLQARNALRFCQDALFAHRRQQPIPSLLPAPTTIR
jgi:transposase